MLSIISIFKFKQNLALKHMIENVLDRMCGKYYVGFWTHYVGIKYLPSCSPHTWFLSSRSHLPFPRYLNLLWILTFGVLVVKFQELFEINPFFRITQLFSLQKVQNFFSRQSVWSWLVLKLPCSLDRELVIFLPQSLLFGLHSRSITLLLIYNFLKYILTRGLNLKNKNCYLITVDPFGVGRRSCQVYQWWLQSIIPLLTDVSG